MASPAGLLLVLVVDGLLISWCSLGVSGSLLMISCCRGGLVVVSCWSLCGLLVIGLPAGSQAFSLPSYFEVPLSASPEPPIRGLVEGLQ